jgi:hypothetical protein
VFCELDAARENFPSEISRDQKHNESLIFHCIYLFRSIIVSKQVNIEAIDEKKLAKFRLRVKRNDVCQKNVTNLCLSGSLPPRTNHERRTNHEFQVVMDQI